jgi:hypothetical protein
LRDAAKRQENQPGALRSTSLNILLPTVPRCPWYFPA